MAAAHDLGGDGAARVLAHVATGVGFLAGGVILRAGFRIQGLNTAATIWCSAPIGCFVGLGHILLGAGATALLVLANSLLHWLEFRFPSLRAPREEREKAP